MINIDIKPEKIEEILTKISIFGALPKDGLDEIVELSSYVKYEKDTFLFKENEPATNIYIIISGKIKIVHNVDTTPFEVVQLGIGSSLGEASVIGIQCHSASAYILEECELMVISRQLLTKLHKQNCELFSLFILNMARELARRVMRYSKEIEIYGGQ